MVRRAGVSVSAKSVPEEWDWERGRRLRDHGERLAAEIAGLLEREEETAIALERSPASVAAEAALRRELRETASSCLEAVAELPADDADVAICRGWAQLELGRWAEAKPLLLAAALAEPAPAPHHQAELRALVHRARALEHLRGETLEVAERMGRRETEARLEALGAEGQALRQRMEADRVALLETQGLSARGSQELERQGQILMGGELEARTLAQERALKQADAKMQALHERESALSQLEPGSPGGDSLSSSLDDVRALRRRMEAVCARAAESEVKVAALRTSTNGLERVRVAAHNKTQKHLRRSFTRSNPEPWLVDGKGRWSTAPDGQNATAPVKALDHRRRWLVRPVGDAKPGLAEAGRGRGRDAAPPWTAAAASRRASRPHRPHLLPSEKETADWAKGHIHSMFEPCPVDCPGRAAPVGLSRKREPELLRCYATTRRLTNDTSQLVHFYSRPRDAEGRGPPTLIAPHDVVFHMDSVWNGFVDGLLAWHADSARAGAGGPQRATQRRLRAALRRSFADPCEAFVFFDDGRGEVGHVQLAAGLRKLHLEGHFRSAELCLTAEAVPTFLAGLSLRPSERRADLIAVFRPREPELAQYYRKIAALGFAHRAAATNQAMVSYYARPCDAPHDGDALLLAGYQPRDASSAADEVEAALAAARPLLAG